MISTMTSSFLNATQPRMNLTINTSTAETKIVGNPKRTKKKLSRFKSYAAEQNQIQTEDESQNRRQSTIDNIIEQYQYCFPITNDGHQIYRIVGMNLIRNLISSQSKVDAFINTFTKKVTNPKILKNYSKDFEHFCCVKKLMNSLPTIISCFKKKPLGSFNRGMGYLLNNYAIFDFALIAIARLYTHYYAKVDIKHNEYVQVEDFILDFNAETTFETIKLISQCFRVEIHIYTISPEIAIMHYLPNIRNQSEPIAIMQIRNKYLLLQNKGEYVKESQKKDADKAEERLPNWVLQTKQSQRSIDSPIKIDFRKKTPTSSIVFQAKNFFPKQTRQSQQPKINQFQSKQSMQLSKISQVESQYRTKIVTPPRQQQQSIITHKILSFHKLQQLTIYPEKQQVVEPPPPKPTLQHYSSLKSFARPVGKIRKQFMSPPVSNRSNQGFPTSPQYKYDLSNLYRVASKPSLQSVNEQGWDSRMYKKDVEKRVVIHTKDFEIEVFRK